MAMTFNEQKTAAKAFAKKWASKGYEKGEAQKFWIELLRQVFGIPNAETALDFERHVDTGFIDVFIPATKVLIEQKSSGVRLDVKAKQSDGSMLTPLEQAQRYATELPHSDHPRWIICPMHLWRNFHQEKN